MITNLMIQEVGNDWVDITWVEDGNEGTFNVYWADANRADMVFKLVSTTSKHHYRLNKATHIPHYLKVGEVVGGKVINMSPILKTPIKQVFKPQKEELLRGLIAVKTMTGIFISWRFMKDEVTGYMASGLMGTDFVVYKNGEKLAVVTDSCNYLDRLGTENDTYTVAPLNGEVESEKCQVAKAWESGENYIEIPLNIPEGGTTPSGQAYTYNANDMSIGDVDGDGEYEYILKWDPTNSQDVSIKGYTGKCYIDCYKLSGRLLWRLDMGVNIRAGAHYTQFMVYDFDGDSQAEMSVKTAPGTQMTRYDEQGHILSKTYITLPEQDQVKGVKHEDNYVCSALDYRQHLTEVFLDWTKHPEVIAGHWPQTLEACFGIETTYEYPLSERDAAALVDYFIHVYAPQRDERNQLQDFEGFIYEGPEYLTMFAGDGQELETIPFKYGREDDGLIWGDYGMKRIEPCNRVDRFLSGIAYLDGEHPYLIVARGYYTRMTMVAYRFGEGHHHEYFAIDSGHVAMSNPFNANAHEAYGSDPVFGKLAGQGNHSLATADVDGDGKQEIIYGGCVIDHDGSVLYSKEDLMPDGSMAKLGHGDAMHVANINPNKPGLEIFGVFEGGIHAPYGYALRDAESGEVIFGEFAEVDLGRCMIGDVDPKVLGLQVWVNETFDCHGNKLNENPLGTNQSIRWAADLSTQIMDGVDYMDGNHVGVINDVSHGVMLEPKGVATNNGTKGNPCLIADVFGDFREELLIRTADSSKIRIYTNTEITKHKLFTPMHDLQYRTGVAWQNNCYNQPGYTSFYYGSDMDWSNVMPELDSKKISVFLAGDSTVQTDETIVPRRVGWGQVFQSLFDGEVTIHNHAKAGRGTKNFMAEGRLDEIKAGISKGDYLLIQFGHNDQKADDPNRYAAPFSAYKDNLKAIIQVARDKQALPVLITPVVLRNYDEQGKLIDFHGDYLSAMKEVAIEEKVALIDLENKSRTLFTELGPVGTKRLMYHLNPGEHLDYPDGIKDNVHFNKSGAKVIAKLVAQGLEELDWPLYKHLIIPS